MHNDSSREKVEHVNAAYMTSDITDLSVRDMARLYRKRLLSPVEVIDASLTRIENLNPTLNAFVTLTEETARIAARSAERQLRASDDLPLLFGIPFSAKDTLPTAGVRTTFGSRLFADVVPDEDAAAVAAVKRAGGILIGKTNSPTLGWIGVTHNKIFGATPNPWDLSVAAGGSSGGAAVAAAARMTPVNIGTDGGGSLRIPASFTATVGVSSRPMDACQTIRLARTGVSNTSGPFAHRRRRGHRA